MKSSDTVAKIIQSIDFQCLNNFDDLGLLANSNNFNEYLCIHGSFFYYVVDIQTMQYLYVSPGINYVLGYQPAELIEKGASFFYENCHPDIILTQKAIHYECERFLCTMPKRSRSNYKFSYDFVVKDSKSNYVRLLQHIRFVKFDKEGKALQLFSICIKIPQCRNEIKHTLAISKMSSKGETIITKKDFYPQFENGILTRTEAMVWGLITDGLTAKEIAIQLGITINTANTHRKNIYKKLKNISS